MEEAKPSEIIRQVKEKVSQEPNVARALDQVKEAVKTASLPPKVVEQLEKAIQDTTKLQQAGQNVQARVQLTNALTQIEQEVQTEEVKPSEVIRQVKEKVAQEPECSESTAPSQRSGENCESATKGSRKIRKSHSRQRKVTTSGQKRTGEGTINPSAKSS